MTTEKTAPVRSDPLAAALRAERSALRARVRRFRIFSIVGYMALVAVAAASGAWRVLPGDWAFLAAWAGILIVMLPLNVGMDYLLVVRPMAPVAELAAWSYDSARQSWASVDGNPNIPRDPDAMLERLGDRSDGQAPSLRVSALWQKEDAAGAARALTNWFPAEPVDRARHARWTELMAFEETGKDGLDDVRKMAKDIKGLDARRRLLTSVAFEQARRAAERDEPVLPIMTAARLDLGNIKTPTLGWAARNLTPKNVSLGLFAVSWLPIAALLALFRL
jgi:hypothetical protein